MTTRVVSNTEPDMSNFDDIDILKAIVKAGAEYQQAQRVIHIPDGPHADNLWLGPLPVMYLDECVGYLVSEGDWVNFHRAILK